MPNFNKVLRALRDEQEISRRELSRRTGISQSSINMYERGEREPNFETLETFADYFNVNMDYLLGKSETRTTNLQNSNLEKENSPSEESLTEGEKMLLDIFRLIPEDQQKVFLEMGRVYANSHKKG